MTVNGPVPDVVALETAVRDYAWGSPDAIPALLGDEPTGSPVAELWVGAHPGDPSHWVREEGAGAPARIGLDALVAADPRGMLGEVVATAFDGRLPFLLKLLAAEKALSLQVHPDLVQARDGFARENAAGVPVGAPHRNYQDDNHKPELLCALTPFEALCGFREPAATSALLTALAVPELAPLLSLVHGATQVRAAVEYLLDLPAARATEVVGAAAVGARTLLERDPGGRYAGEADLLVRLAGQSPGEIGPVVALLLNRLVLQPGEAVFLAAGQVHAYVRGFGVEILANSDNVLRCGLTPKHVDVEELLQVATFRPSPAEPWPARGSGDVVVYPVPVDDFELARHETGPEPRDLRSTGPQLLLATGGRVIVRGAGAEVALTPGRAAFVPAERAVTVSGPGTVFRATAGPRLVGAGPATA